MSSPDAAERTLPPTERRRREARARGELVRSSALTSSLVLLAASSAAWWFAPILASQFASILRHALATAPVVSRSPTVSTMTALIQQTGEIIAVTILPGVAFVFSGAVLANLVQTGWVWNPISAVSRPQIRSHVSWKRTAESVGMLLKASLLVFISGNFVWTHFLELFLLEQAEPAALLTLGARLVGQLLLQLSICLMLLGFMDYAFRFWQHEQLLKMTIDERRREQQEDEVDEGIKKRRAEIRHSGVSEAKSVESI
jgi:flagellar biosynthetic protein FlhB